MGDTQASTVYMGQCRPQVSAATEQAAWWRCWGGTFSPCCQDTSPHTVSTRTLNPTHTHARTHTHPPHPHTRNPPPPKITPNPHNPPWVQQVLIRHVVDTQPQVSSSTQVNQLHTLVTHRHHHILGLDVTVDCEGGTAGVRRVQRGTQPHTLCTDAQTTSWLAQCCYACTAAISRNNLNRSMMPACVCAPDCQSHHYVVGGDTT